MGRDYYDMRDGKVALAGALEKLGWKIHGFIEDQSDSMTDYYCPAHWSGIATKGNAVAVVDNNGFDSGREISTTKPTIDGTCPRCMGTGEDPTGWTLSAARSDAVNFNTQVCHIHDPSGCTRNLFPDVVSPLGFLGNGKLACLGRGCHGGNLMEYKNEVVGHWPTFQGNPARRKWHVERGGVILASGVGLSSCKPVSKWDEETRRNFYDTSAADSLAQKIDKAATGAADAAPSARVTVDAATLSENADKGGLELRFPSRPPAGVLDSLKAHGWRWSRFSGCWWIKASDSARSFANSILNGEVAA